MRKKIGDCCSCSCCLFPCQVWLPLFPTRSTSNRILRQISDTCKWQNDVVVQMTVTLYLLFSTILESSLIISDSSQLGSWQFLTGSKTKRTQLVFCWTSVMGGSRFYFLCECISYARTCLNEKRREKRRTFWASIWILILCPQLNVVMCRKVTLCSSNANQWFKVSKDELVGRGCVYMIVRFCSLQPSNYWQILLMALCLVSDVRLCIVNFFHCEVWKKRTWQ